MPARRRLASASPFLPEPEAVTPHPHCRATGQGGCTCGGSDLTGFGVRVNWHHSAMRTELPPSARHCRTCSERSRCLSPSLYIGSRGPRVRRRGTKQKGDGMGRRWEGRSRSLGMLVAGVMRKDVVSGLKAKKEPSSEGSGGRGVGRGITCAEAPRRGTACCDQEEEGTQVQPGWGRQVGPRRGRADIGEQEVGVSSECPGSPGALTRAGHSAASRCITAIQRWPPPVSSSFWKTLHFSRIIASLVDFNNW